MSSTKSLCELALSSKDNLLPGKRSVSVKLSKGVDLTLDVPFFGTEAQSECRTWNTSNIVLKHTAFKAQMLPGSANGNAFHRTCAAEVDAISCFFPYITSEPIYIAFSAWLAFACAMDDILETLSPQGREAILTDCVNIVQDHLTRTSGKICLTRTLRWFKRLLNASKSHIHKDLKETRVQALTPLLLAHCANHLSQESTIAFFKAIIAVFNAHKQEARFIRGRIPNDIPTYMQFRSLTISLNPFFEVIKCEYLPQSWKSISSWDRLQLEVSRAAGLQNDLIGLEKDIKQGEPLNAVLVLHRGAAAGEIDINDHYVAQLVTFVVQEHNKSVSTALDCFGDLCLAASGVPHDSFMAIASVARHILLLADTHLKWCSTAKRYQVNVVSEPSLQQPTSPSASSSNTQMVRSVNIYHGLPSYSYGIEKEGLTALVTGATGLSGYHMVKVLASSRRWKRIICLGSRPPPAGFFAGLSEGAARVEHLAVNFLQDPAEITRRMASKVENVDYIFYFSYVQPASKGDVLDLWANADELATKNSTMFTNFLTSLGQLNLRPRRFLLQTGTKHYAFYLGPASVPAFECDPRVTLARNFYYEQEEALSTYCRDVGASWGVARPSYIVGAVPDGSLNHLVGFGIYAAVQARLGQPIRFPGDYNAWDREQVQSSAMLNAYFEEWMVLSEEAANQAFNIHDGHCFTWGRLWPSLAQWYGVEWTPPETDGMKYREMTLPYPKTPRGYGPQTTFRSTHSLLEWSLQPEVKAVWAELAKEYGLVLNPFSDQYRARIFSFSDSAVIGNSPMTTSLRKARKFGFHGTVDSYHSIFNTFHELAGLKLVPRPVQTEFDGGY